VKALRSCGFGVKSPLLWHPTLDVTHIARSTLFKEIPKLFANVTTKECLENRFGERRRDHKRAELLLLGALNLAPSDLPAL